MRKSSCFSSCCHTCEVLPHSNTADPFCLNYYQLHNTDDAGKRQGCTTESASTAEWCQYKKPTFLWYLTPSRLVRADTNIACSCHSRHDSRMDTEGKFGSVTCSSLSASYHRKETANPTHSGGKWHATIASTNSTVKQRHLSRMLKALRAKASVTSIASGCQRWLKTWEQASVLKILCVGVCVRTSQRSKSDIWGALYRSQRLLGIFCIT